MRAAQGLIKQQDTSRVFHRDSQIGRIEREQTGGSRQRDRIGYDTNRLSILKCVLQQHASNTGLVTVDCTSQTRPVIVGQTAPSPGFVLATGSSLAYGLH